MRVKQNKSIKSITFMKITTLCAIENENLFVHYCFMLHAVFHKQTRNSHDDTKTNRYNSAALF